MSSPILAAKLFIPPQRPNAVPRAELLARLQAGLDRRLTLISASAGFGKTTLASAWIAGCNRPAAWLALDHADSDPTRFVAYLVAALQTIAPSIGADVGPLLRSAQPPIATLLALLLNQLATLPQPALLVLDDYHVLEGEAIEQALAFLVEHLPPQLHLVIITRADPALPLARYRAQGQLHELRATDLRFTPTEAAAFLTQVMGLGLSAADIGVLETRTEGWIAGLQLAALSLRGHQDSAGFIQVFAGNHRYILEYLLDEVLQRQPADVRRFLLQTAILDRLHGPLCDAVTDQEQSSVRLEALYRGNFFVVPLDDQRQWYRYHHLFADVLAAQLVAEQPELVSTLHRRASVWYEQNGAPSDAIRHALAAQDYERAADLVEVVVPALHQQRQEAVALGWLKALPDHVIAWRPVLAVYYAGTLLATGELAGVERRLQEAERLLRTNGRAAAGTATTFPERTGSIVVRDQIAFERLPGAIALYRAALALGHGDRSAAIAFATQARDLVTEEDLLRSGAATALLGLALWNNGELEAAYESFAAGLIRLRAAGNIADAIGGAVALLDIRVTQGRLGDAMRICEHGLRLALEHGTPHMRGTADMLVGLGELARERGDLPAATHYLLRSQQQGEHTGFPQHPYRWRVALARIRASQGDLAGALELFEEAERRYVGDFFPPVRPIAAWKARIWIAQGRPGDALRWARDRGLSIQDEANYLQEFEHLTLARALLRLGGHDGALSEVSGFLCRLLDAAEAGGRIGSMLEMLLLLALVHHALGDLPAALAFLSRALTLAEPEGYVQLFLDEGPAVAALLALAAQQPHPPRLVRELFQASGNYAPLRQPFYEPLSQRERDVLRLLSGDLAGPDIATALVISLNTLRTHTKHIYAKLGVTNRRAAVRRASELGLL
jgi:LuxR family maltose regulon positive regulatory protein